MKYYHFTAKRFLTSIKKEGLTKGKLLVSMYPIKFIENMQWITKNPNFYQSWAVGTGRLPYKRNEVRLTIDIPEEFKQNVSNGRVCLQLLSKEANTLLAYGDPENWIIYRGKIDPKWITKVDFKESEDE